MTAPGGSPSPALRRDTRSTGRRDVGNIHGPDLVRTRDLYAAQQIGIDLVATLRLRCARSAIERFYPHPPHQRFDMPAADLAPLGSQQASQDPRASEWELQVQLIEAPHDREVGGRHGARQIIDAATSACFVIDRSCSRSIIALRSAIPPW